ncbi:hypothetical protein NQ176_g8348 [Zarea fungicola]|uniref:Uncharacterized protein n=1 Tax=Zarea fungicola TaxID=93591 RepID=A0ACC1MTE4_9HYPO|nr:hypothetical protein NQ176_g8348 [Lecanicillium fungicola]
MSGLKIPPEISSRTWLQGGMSGTYRFGDARALAGEEINIIIKPLYDMITASREEHTWHSISNLSHSLDTFDLKMIAWGEYWGPIFRSCEHTVRSLEAQIHMYCNHVRTHFNTVLLHRTLVEAEFVPNAAVQAAVIRSYQTALATLKQATIIGKAEVLYYLWDTAHLMIAYTAMVLLKILKQAPGCHGVSASEAYAVLDHLTDLHTTAAAAVQTSEGEPRDKNQPTSTIEAQARLLKAILFRIKADVIPLQHRHSTVGDGYEVVGNSSNIQAIHTTDTMVQASNEGTMPVLPPPVMLEQEPAPHEPGLQGLSEEPLDVSLLTDEMDYLLSSDAVENWFSNAGLLPWDEQGIFKDYR